MYTLYLQVDVMRNQMIIRKYDKKNIREAGPLERSLH